MLHNMINLNKWNELPKSYQQVIRSASAEANVWMQAKYDALNAAALKRLVANGAQLRAFPTEVLDACFNSAKTVYAEISGQNADFKKVHDAMMAYRAEAYLWFQLSEYTFDIYMMNQQRKKTI